VLCLPGRVLKTDEARGIVKTWLSTPFSGAERHKRRIGKVKKIEDQEFESHV